jgi:hypothetical protein
LGEGFDAGFFVGDDFEDGVELGHLQQVGHFFGEVDQFELAAFVADAGEKTDQGAEAGAVDVFDVGEVEQDLFAAFGDEFAAEVADGGGTFAEFDASGDADNFYSLDKSCDEFHFAVPLTVSFVVNTIAQVGKTPNLPFIVA